MSVHSYVVNPLHYMFYDKNAYTLSQRIHGFSNSPSVDLGNYICRRVRGMSQCKCNLFVSATPSSVRETAELHLLCFIKLQIPAFR
jgi:hypothetical protein